MIPDCLSRVVSVENKTKNFVFAHNFKSNGKNEKDLTQRVQLLKIKENWLALYR